MNGNRRFDLPEWVYRGVLVLLISALAWLAVDKLSLIDRRLLNIESSVSSMPVLADHVAILWKRAFGGKI